MFHDFQNMYFSSHSFNIVDVVNFPFVQDFDCYFLAGVDMISLFDFSKCALSQSLFNFIIAYHLRSIMEDAIDLSFIWHQDLRDSPTFIDINIILAILTIHDRCRSFSSCGRSIISDDALVVVLLKISGFLFLVDHEILM